MPDHRPSRRRFLTILAAVAAGGFRPGEAHAETFEWGGVALGADARLVLEGDADRAEATVAQCLAEVARLEAIFSLHLEDSEICRLNRAGVLDAPSLDLVALLQQARAMHAATEGLFDPTVQPLWAHYARLGASGTAEGTRAQLTALLGRVGMDRVEIAAHRITLPSGAAITLNGIAQGYITDRVAHLLRRSGWSRVLVDMGEVSVPGDRPFDVEVRETALRIPLASAALATSSDDLGFPGVPGVRHILLPATGATPRHWRAVTVKHASATIADGLSTALFLAGPQQFSRILARFPGAQAWRKA